MAENSLDLTVSRLGECRIPSPMSHVQFVGDDKRVLYHSDCSVIEAILKEDESPPCFEMAGPRERIYYDPSKVKCGIVTCGGLCPGFNDVIRAVVLSLFHHYGVKTVFGFRYGFEGLSYKYGHTPVELTPDKVQAIHQQGGTILGTSRGPQDISEMVDTLERMNVGILFTIGGDGTLRGAQAIAEEIESRVRHIKSPLKVAIMGCEVNGPGEAADSDVGLAGGRGVGLIFRSGQVVRRVSESEMIDALMDEIESVALR